MFNSINIRIETGYDDKEGKDFLKCEYFKDGDSYRSPFSNMYFPKIDVEPGDDEPIYPTQELLEMEGRAN